MRARLASLDPSSDTRRGGPAPVCAGSRVGAACPCQACQSGADLSRARGVLAGPGRPLAGDVRRDMEARFGQDCSSVRVHSGAAARQSAAALNAEAYTLGRDVVLGTEHPGRELLAHELAHVARQPAVPTGALRLGSEHDSEELRADAAARSALAGRRPPRAAAVPAGVLRRRLLTRPQSVSTACLRERQNAFLLSERIARNYVTFQVGHVPLPPPSATCHLLDQNTPTWECDLFYRPNHTLRSVVTNHTAVLERIQVAVRLHGSLARARATFSPARGPAVSGQECLYVLGCQGRHNALARLCHDPMLQVLRQLLALPSPPSTRNPRIAAPNPYAPTRRPAAQPPATSGPRVQDDEPISPADLPPSAQPLPRELE